MKLIIGLGNPDSKYARNRHNLGFMAVDYFASQNNLGNFKSAHKYQAEVLEHVAAKEKALLLKPQSFMNKSGEVVRQAMSFHKLKAEDVLVVYDELALDFGTVRTRADGSSAGHNGVESVISHLGKGFNRIRTGIANQHLKNTDASEFVLSDFNKEEAEQLPHIFDYTDQLIQEFITLGKLEATTHNALEKLIK